MIIFLEIPQAVLIDFMLGLTIRFRHVRCTDYPQVFASTVPLPFSSPTVVEGKANERILWTWDNSRLISNRPKKVCILFIRN